MPPTLPTQAVRVDAARPPRPGRVESRRPAARLGLRRLVLAATQPHSRHVQVSCAAIHLASMLARGECQLQ